MDWYQYDIPKLFEHFQTTEEGLRAQQVISYRTKHASRAFPEDAHINPYLVFLKQFASPFVLLLLAAATFSLIMGETKDFIAISAVLTLNSGLGTYFELRTDKLSRNLRAKLKFHALVRRDGKILEIPLNQLVPGDCVILQSGHYVPADCRLIQANFLQVDESTLTGESLPVLKNTQVIPHAAILGEQNNMVFQGTYVVGGTGEALVTAVGLDSVMGQIQKASKESASPDSPLVTRIKELNRIMGIASCCLGGILVIYLLLMQHSLFSSLEIAIALVVAIVPEGLPILLTLTLLIGVHKLAEEKALVKNLAAIDTLANVDLLISDKTGTITQNKLHATGIVLPEGNKASYYPLETATTFIPGVQQLLNAAVLANETSALAHLKHRLDPLEKALIEMAESLRADSTAPLKKLRSYRVLPFSSEYKFMAAFYKHSPRTVTVYIKGAWEVVLNRCTHIVTPHGLSPLTTEIREQVEAIMEKHQAAGNKLLAFAQKEHAFHDHKTPKDLKHQLKELEDLIFVGATIIEDPLRPDAKSVTAALQEAGIELKIASGDHTTTTQAIAHSINMPVHILTKSVTESSPTHLSRATVFSRVSPLDKLKLVQFYQKRKHIVAMTGDGANDAPALKQADIGIALSSGGNDIAQAAADIILTDNSLRTIQHALEYGRTLTRNLQRIMVFLLTCNATEAIVIFLVTIITGQAGLLIPSQILLINLLSDTPLALPLAFESQHEPYRRQSRQTIFSFSSGQWVTMILGATAMVTATLIIFFTLRILEIQGSLQQTAVLYGIIVTQMWFLLSLRSGPRPLWTYAWGSNRMLELSVGIVFSLLVSLQIIKPLQDIFHLATLSGPLILFIGGISLLVPLTTEVTKFFTQRHTPTT